MAPSRIPPFLKEKILIQQNCQFHMRGFPLSDRLDTPLTGKNEIMLTARKKLMKPIDLTMKRMMKGEAGRAYGRFPHLSGIFNHFARRCIL